MTPWYEHALTAAYCLLAIILGYFYVAPILAHIIRQHGLT